MKIVDDHKVLVETPRHAPLRHDQTGAVPHNLNNTDANLMHINQEGGIVVDRKGND